MPTTTKAPFTVLLAAIALVALSGCDGGPDGSAPATPPPTATVTVTPSPTAGTAATTPAPTAPADASTPTCGPADPTADLTRALGQLGPPAGLDGRDWDVAGADRAAYDPCAALASVVVGAVDASASSPFVVLLFHDGRYLGTATKAQYAFVPEVTRTSDTTLSVRYRFVQGAESNARASGRATATYTWDDQEGRVVMGGDVPPTP